MGIGVMTVTTDRNNCQRACFSYVVGFSLELSVDGITLM